MESGSFFAAYTHGTAGPRQIIYWALAKRIECEDAEAHVKSNECDRNSDIWSWNVF